MRSIDSVNSCWHSQQCRTPRWLDNLVHGHMMSTVRYLDQQPTPVISIVDEVMDYMDSDSRFVI